MDDNPTARDLLDEYQSIMDEIKSICEQLEILQSRLPTVQLERRNIVAKLDKIPTVYFCSECKTPHPLTDAWYFLHRDGYHPYCPACHDIYKDHNPARWTDRPPTKG